MLKQVVRKVINMKNIGNIIHRTAYVGVGMLGCATILPNILLLLPL